MTSPYDRPAITVGELRALLSELPEDMLISSSESDYENMGTYTRFLSIVTAHLPESPTGTDRGEVSFFFGLTGLERWEEDEQPWYDDDDEDPQALDAEVAS